MAGEPSRAEGSGVILMFIRCEKGHIHLSQYEPYAVISNKEGRLKSFLEAIREGVMH
ncbi:hypothetical protein ECA0675 [Pectobacterium atrosepticum SCRI1043]|uniref:Uncharacterized protein n=1 Tax=Pectobacterium atrosepticum (strain SCRI 1043 / ATCC BAA-672) TaxID=218491 RepID=Q6D9E1_PECAS|nr:hypothetical protein ECA0675 [Pectobacterium atrosepticum SCRI1043]